MVTRRGYGAAVGIVHNVGGNYQRLKVASSIQRAAVDVEINSTTPRTRLQFDWEANRVISIENAAY